MTNSAMTNSALPNPADNLIEQAATGNQNQIIGQAVSSTIFNVTGGQITIYPSQLDRPATVESEASTSAIGANPYKGLLAFQETDGDRFFGREKEIKILWEKLSLLHEEPQRTSILPIYGPSGSGKSSLARAGLIPELARRPLPGRDRARVAILVPGAYPLEALAAVLARVATNDPTPVAKTREFATELAQPNAAGAYDGLRRIVNVLPETHVSPLILLVDQFEEIYTLCKNSVQRDRFVENLLHAAAEEAQQMLIIITLRSDFLDDIQKKPSLSRLFSGQGYLVPAMDAEELREIIVKPTNQTGYTFDEATISWLVSDTKGRDGALPLLQCALSDIWQGLQKGIAPVETLKAMGCVGGVLAGRAQAVYDSLDATEQAIARRLFRGLVQLGNGIKNTRRQVAVDCLTSYKDDPNQVRQVIYRFAEPSVRLITCSISQEGVETAEITHEGLLDNWALLKEWLGQCKDLRFQRHLEEDAQDWEKNGRLAGSLWRSPEFDLLKQYQQQYGDNLTRLQMEFFLASQKAEEIRKQEEIQEPKKERQQRVLQGVLCGLILGAIGLAGYQQQQIEVQRVRQLAEFSEGLLSTQPLNAETAAIAQINAIAAVNLSQSPLVRWTQHSIAESAEQALLHTVQVAEARKVLVSQVDQVVAIAFSGDGKKIASGGADHKVRLWNANVQQPIGKPFGKQSEWHQKAVLAVAFSPDGKRLVSGSVDRTIRVWDAATGKPIGKPLIGHGYSVVSVAFSPDGKQIVSGSDDKTIRVWDAATGRQLMQMQGEPFQPILVGFSLDGKTVFSRSFDNVMRFWDVGTGALKSEQNNLLQTSSIAFTSGGKTIVSRNSVDPAHLEDLFKTACDQLDTYSNLLKDKTKVTEEIRRTCKLNHWKKPQP